MNFIFDMDGVLINSEPLHARSRLEVLASFGIVPDMDMSSVIGSSTLAFWEKMVQKYGLKETAADLERTQMRLLIDTMIKEKCPPPPGLFELLDALEGMGIGLAVGSSSRRMLVEAVLDYLGIASRFKAVVTGDDVENLKPAPDIYLLAMERLGAEKHQAVAIEDSRLGIQAALTAGIPCIAYRNPTSPNQDLSAATYQVDALLKVLDLRKGDRWLWEIGDNNP
ncbi:HAD family hydrolase [Thermoclostridium caenicola]|uniref:Haloacid dehalogenase superfamily, subfamily IA, variant 3 with third motif having DD or ED n=1 Tax=Thermoclostridium caenicola TaxID=659425 RepID=A0A1M6D3J2_9FIRM|nr:HAD family phosphatase [Thermoclostridium caenicola]SHI67691.1 haloacid dehalogenase superfamily, subfamily IA, variant 3 with third motif having DD or ED [Thermoclostridium caenicola]